MKAPLLRDLRTRLPAERTGDRACAGAGVEVDERHAAGVGDGTTRRSVSAPRAARRAEPRCSRGDSAAMRRASSSATRATSTCPPPRRRATAARDLQPARLAARTRSSPTAAASAPARPRPGALLGRPARVSRGRPRRRRHERARDFFAELAASPRERVEVVLRRRGGAAVPARLAAAEPFMRSSSAS